MPQSPYEPSPSTAGIDDRFEIDRLDYERDNEDEDEDMSDGGAQLTSTLSHTQALDEELDLIDAEIMGPQNLLELLHGTNYHSNLMQDSSHTPTLLYNPDSSISDPDQIYSDHADQMEYDELSFSAQSASNLPSAMSELSQQQQHIQDGQEHEDSTQQVDEQHNAFLVTMTLDEQFNLGLSDFLYSWGMSATSEGQMRRGCRVPNLSAVDHQRNSKPSIRRDELNGERYDFQGLDWEKIGVTRAEARQVRRETYKNYTNLQIDPRWHAREERTILSDHENFFRFRRMDCSHNVHLSHFQLRNLLACSSRNQVFYAGRSEILCVDTLTEETSRDYSTSNDWHSGGYGTILDLTDPDVQGVSLYGNGIQISTLTVAHDILIAGGFAGEYAMLNLRGSKSSKHVEGLITDHINGITNHIEIHLSRGSSLPRAAFASNDNGVRILDIGTNKFIAEHKYGHAINCTAGSPDHRLRVLVGDSRKVLICNAETGETLQELDGHHDFGFACDWAPDGVTVATGNQDMLVKIWDARKWTTTDGTPCPVATLQADMAGVRKLKFSPLGSGKRVLVAAEPADILSIIDAETFSTKQTLNFFGEIGGFDFANNGQDLVVANCDTMRGGLMMFERCGHANEALYATVREDPHRGRVYRGYRGVHTGYDWMPAMNEITAHPRATRTARHRERKAAYLGSLGEF
ncbi:hypothetical protein B7463_g10689, partial [Scytalidium lignicola]